MDNTKICSTCNQRLSLEQFYDRKNTTDGKKTQCKECCRARIRTHYRNNKTYYLERNKKRVQELNNFVKEYKEKLVCSICGEDRWYCLEFHHMSPSEKETNIPNMVNNGRSIKKILEEIAKCQILCGNCHRELHYKERTNTAG